MRGAFGVHGCDVCVRCAKCVRVCVRARARVLERVLVCALGI